MKKRLLSILIVLLIFAFTMWGTITTASATEQEVDFYFSSFGEVEKVILENQIEDIAYILSSDELFGFYTSQFVTRETNTIKVTKVYCNGTEIEQQFDVSSAVRTVGVYDDGIEGKSWLEIDGEFIMGSNE